MYTMENYIMQLASYIVIIIYYITAYIIWIKPADNYSYCSYCTCMHCIYIATACFVGVLQYVLQQVTILAFFGSQLQQLYCVCLRLYVCVCMCVCACVCLYACMTVCMCLCAYSYICLYVYMHVCVCVCVCVVCACSCMHVCMFADP